MAIRLTGKPDFRVIKPHGIVDAVMLDRCWICGDKLGVHRVYAIGPICAINRVTSEPPSHRECAEFAVRACPFMLNPREKRSEKNLTEFRQIAGIHIDRNPGVFCLYETREAKPFRAGSGVLFKLGHRERVDWYCQGRKATRAEAEASMMSGYPLLMEMAEKEGREAVEELEQLLYPALQLLPAAA